LPCKKKAKNILRKHSTLIIIHYTNGLTSLGKRRLITYIFIITNKNNDIFKFISESNTYSLHFCAADKQKKLANPSPQIFKQ
jgi:hypothetical protein